ncbi:hypothetical protein KI387_020778, partial [Taxus chinensis]
ILKGVYDVNTTDGFEFIGTDDVGIPILGSIDEDMADVEVLVKVGGVTFVEGVTDAEGVTDVEGVFGDVGAELGNVEVAFTDMVGGMEV